jgi:uncharacterized protein
MKHLLNWIEIPVSDMERAKKFYGIILGGISLIDYPMTNPSDEYAIFPSNDAFNAGALAKSEFHKPSVDGVTIYLDGGEDLDIILQKAEKNGGQILMPKTFVSEDTGYIGLFLDSEGNKIGLQNK